MTRNPSGSTSPNGKQHGHDSLDHAGRSGWGYVRLRLRTGSGGVQTKPV